MKKFLVEVDENRWGNSEHETYEEAEKAAKLRTMKELEVTKIIRRELLATVKPDIKDMPVIVERNNPA